jgi:hypothetical protein
LPIFSAKMSSFDIDDIPGTLKTWAQNISTNTHESFARLGPKDYFRIVIVIGAYALIIRPFLVKLGERAQRKQHERDAEDSTLLTEIDPRTGMPRKMAIPGVDSDSDEDEDGVKADPQIGEWGRKARLRQRKVVRTAMEISEGRLQAEDVEDIKDLLLD